jgi:hypothetical protein
MADAGRPISLPFPDIGHPDPPTVAHAKTPGEPPPKKIHLTTKV